MRSWAKTLIVNEFHKLYYEGIEDERLFEQTTWLGITCLKCPLDLWIYQEILYQLKPDLIIETGSYHGGSALYLAHLCEALGQGHVVTIDVMEMERKPHPRVTYLTGSSTDPEIAQAARGYAPDNAKVMVILDSDHRKSHVLDELELYGPMVPEGSYLIVEDTNINGHPVRVSFGDGPFEAVTEFLQKSREFVPDFSRERLLLTFNPHGYLKRTADRGPPPPESDSPAELLLQPPELIQILEQTHSSELERLAEEFKQVNRDLKEAWERESAAWEQTHKAQEQATEAWEKVHKAQARESEAWKHSEAMSKQVDEARSEANRLSADLARVKEELIRLRSIWPIKLMLWLRGLLRS